MGIELVKFIVARCGRLKLSGNAFKVLVAMATSALDQPNTRGQTPRLYFGGWAPLALALGFDPEANDRKAKEAVRRAIKELRDAGVVTPMAGHAHTGTRQSYRLNLSLDAAANWAPASGAQVVPQVGGLVVPQVGGNWAPEAGAPRTNTGSHEDLSQDFITHPSALTTDRARANAATDEIKVQASKPHAFQPDAHGASCEVCELGERHPRHDARSIA